MPRFICQERNKQVVHNVWLMEFSKEYIAALWEKSREHRILFSDDINGDFHKFINIFMYESEGRIDSKGLVYIMDDFVGMVFVSDITSKECSLHFSFFDGRLRFDVSKQMIRYIFDEYEFERINTKVVPFASKRVIAFIEELGFVREGRKRKALEYKGGKFDLTLYGLLKEEFFELLDKPQEKEQWDTTKEQLEAVQQEA